MSAWTTFCAFHANRRDRPYRQSRPRPCPVRNHPSLRRRKWAHRPNASPSHVAQRRSPPSCNRAHIGGFAARYRRLHERAFMLPAGRSGADCRTGLQRNPLGHGCWAKDIAHYRRACRRLDCAHARALRISHLRPTRTARRAARRQLRLRGNGLEITRRSATSIINKTCEYGILKPLGNMRRGDFYQAPN